MRIIAIKRTDGGVSIMRIIDDAADVASEIVKWQSSGLTAASSRIIQSTDLPATRTDRDAWEDV